MKIWILSLTLLVASTVHAQKPEKWQLADLQKKIDSSKGPMIINFWATFCIPCIHELPYFEAVHKQHPEIEMIIVSLDLPDAYPKTIQNFLTKKGFTIKSAWLNETDADLFCPVVSKDWSGSIPATLFIDNKKGYRKFFEKELKEQELKTEVQSLLHKQ